jgi:hypothetical protein
VPEELGTESHARRTMYVMCTDSWLPACQARAGFGWADYASSVWAKASWAHRLVHLGALVAWTRIEYVYKGNRENRERSTSCGAMHGRACA